MEIFTLHCCPVLGTYFFVSRNEIACSFQQANAYECLGVTEPSAERVNDSNPVHNQHLLSEYMHKAVGADVLGKSQEGEEDTVCLLCAIFLSLSSLL